MPWTDAELDSLCTSGYPLTVGTTSAPCDPFGADVVVAGESDGVGGTQLSSLSVLVRASAFPLLDDEDAVTLSSGLLAVSYTVQGTPQRVQDGLMFAVQLQTVPVVQI